MTRGQVKRRIFWSRVFRALAAPLRYLERRRSARFEHELALKRLEIEANNKPIELLATVMKDIADKQAAIVESGAKTTDVLKAWLDGFKVTSEPSTQTMTAGMEDMEDHELDAFLSSHRGEGRVPPQHPQDTDAWINARFNNMQPTRLAPPIGPDFLGLPFDEDTD